LADSTRESIASHNPLEDVVVQLLI